jgi:hypothetical protein
LGVSLAPLPGQVQKGSSMSRLTDHQDSKIVCEYYGINSRTYKVECVSETKGGILSFMRGGSYISHSLSGKEGQDECAVVFDMVEIRPVRGSMMADQEHTDRIRAELREKAAQMRASG